MVTKEMIDPLLKQRETIHQELKKLNNAIAALQDVCEHEYINDGYDSHKDHYICKICSRKDAW